MWNHQQRSRLPYGLNWLYFHGSLHDILLNFKNVNFFQTKNNFLDGENSLLSHTTSETDIEYKQQYNIVKSNVNTFIYSFLQRKK